MSRSGKESIHIGGGTLPESESPFTAPLSERGRIEMYERSRFTGGTGPHFEETSFDEILSAQPVVDRIIDIYDASSSAQDKAAVNQVVAGK